MLTKGHADVLQILTVVIKVSYFPVRSCRCVTNINCSYKSKLFPCHVVQMCYKN